MALVIDQHRNMSRENKARRKTIFHNQTSYWDCRKELLTSDFLKITVTIVSICNR